MAIDMMEKETENNENQLSERRSSCRYPNSLTVCSSSVDSS
ncbi:hypothetical protein [Streptomyces hydrogenans]